MTLVDFYENPEKLLANATNFLIQGQELEIDQLLCITIRAKFGEGHTAPLLLSEATTTTKICTHSTRIVPSSLVCFQILNKISPQLLTNTKL